MKLLVFDASMGLRGVGGAPRVAAALFYGLRKKGISTYYLGRKSNYIGKDARAFFIEQDSFASTQARRHIGGALRPLAESWPARVAYYSVHSLTRHTTEEMEKWVSKAKPDIVLSSSIQDYVLLRSLKGFMPGAKIVYIDHANVSVTSGSSLEYNKLGFTFGTGRYAGLEGAKKRFFSFFDGVVALNKEQRKAIERFNRNVTVIHSSSLIRGTSIAAAKLALLRKRLSMGKGDRAVLYLGRLSEQQKNVGTLIRAFRQVRDPHLRLLIVGDGSDIGMYRRMSDGDGRISITGRSDDDMLPYYYSLADLYVLPSVWEAFNATFIEAASFGAPLLLSVSSVNSDIIERFGPRLYTFDPYNADELKWKIERFFNDKQLQLRLRALSGDIAREYSSKAQIDGYAAALKHLHKRGRF